MIILYENDEAEKGTLVYINSFPDEDYDKWFEQPNPITPIYNNDTDDEENYVYDEQLSLFQICQVKYTKSVNQNYNSC